MRPKVKVIADLRGRFDGEVVDLTEINPGTSAFRRTVIKTLNAEKFGISVADYFLARAA